LNLFSPRCASHRAVKPSKLEKEIKGRVKLEQLVCGRCRKCHHP